MDKILPWSDLLPQIMPFTSCIIQVSCSAQGGGGVLADVAFHLVLGALYSVLRTLQTAMATSLLQTIMIGGRPHRGSRRNR